MADEYTPSDYLRNNPNPPPSPTSTENRTTEVTTGTESSGNGDTTASDTSTGGGDTSEVQSFSISHLPFRFNPPLHKDARFKVVDISEGATFPTRFNSEFYDDIHNQYDAKLAVREDGKKTGFEHLRLGRIIMDDFAVTKTILDSGKRYGFRFLYNPVELSGSLNVGTDFIPDQRSAASAVLQKGIENLHLEVLLNRIPDVISNAKASDYDPAISAEDRARILEQGTAYDLDFLYRCSTGLNNTLQRQKTGDIGVLLPNPCRLILGPYTSRGALVNVSVDHQMFSENMVPILSYVNITFARFLNMAQKDMDLLETYGITREGGSDEGSDGEGDDSGRSGGGGGWGDGGDGSSPTPPSNLKKPNYPINFSGAKGTSTYGHQIHSEIAQTFTWQDRSGGFGDRNAGDSNHGTGRALDIMQSSTEPRTSSHRGWQIARYLKNNADRLYVTQVIFQQKIWTTQRGGEGWRSYTANRDHYNHIHVSFGPGSGNEDRSKHLTLTTSQQYWG